MIALDASAIVAMALDEPEARLFNETIASEEALVGAPTLLEIRMVLSSKISDPDSFMDEFLGFTAVHAVAFSFEMYKVAGTAFDRYGKGRHPANLNFGDCMAYAVAKVHDVPLLYKGGDFGHTDIRPALP